MLVEHETFPTQLLGQLDLLQYLLVVNVVGRVEIGKVSRQYVDVETQSRWTFVVVAGLAWAANDLTWTNPR